MIIIECVDCGIHRPARDIEVESGICYEPAVCGDYGTGSQFHCESCSDWRPISEYNYHNGDRKCDECFKEYLREYGDV
jgi:hypothetical protein